MPIYEYRCSLCGEKFEKLVRTTSGPVEVRCPNCSTDQVERQVSLFGFCCRSGGEESYAPAPSCKTAG